MSLERKRRTDGTVVWTSKIIRRHKIYRKYLGPIPKADAQKADTAFKRSVEAELYRPRPRVLPTVEQLAERWLAAYTPGHRPSSTARHVSRLRHHLLRVVHDEPITILTTAFLQDYIAHRHAMGAAPRTINGELSTLSLLVNFAIAREWLRPTDRPQFSRVRAESKAMRLLSGGDEKALLMASPCQLRPLIRFALQTGLRRNELVTLTWAAIDRRQRVVTVTSERAKSRRTRRIPLTDTALHILEEVRSPRDDQGARVFGYRSIAETFDRAVKRANLPGVSCHTLRHTWATRCMEAGVPAHVLQRWLGHHNLSVTDRYVHTTPAFEHEAIKRLDMASIPLTVLRRQLDDLE